MRAMDAPSDKTDPEGGARPGAVLACVGAGGASADVVRCAHRMAQAQGAPWLAVFVETPRLQRLPQPLRERVIRTLKLAERLGAEVVTLSGERIDAQLLALVRERGCRSVVLGKSRRPRRRYLPRRTLAGALLRADVVIDLHVITGATAEPPPLLLRVLAPKARWMAYVKASLVVAATTVAAALLSRYTDRVTLVMVFLLGTMAVAWRYGRGPSVLTAIASVVLFDFLFVPTYFSFILENTEYFFTFAAMLGTGLSISELIAYGRRQADIARHREARTRALYRLSRALAEGRSLDELAQTLASHVMAWMECSAAVLMPDVHGRIQDPGGFATRVSPNSPDGRLPVPGDELQIAQHAFDYRDSAGLGTGTLASGDVLYVPLNALERCVGVLAVRPFDRGLSMAPEQAFVLDAFATQAAVAIERVRLAEAAQAAGVAVEAERMRNVVLSSISHDFRTPLATIVGSASTLLDDDAAAIDRVRRRSLLRGVVDEARRLNRLMTDLLDMTRWSSGRVSLKLEWVAIDELIGAVLVRFDEALGDREVTTRIDPDLPLARCDEVLIAQLLGNLLDNAVKHTRAGTAIAIAAERAGEEILLSVRDHGDGLPAGQEDSVFEKFHRGRSEGAQSGFGLGLALCKYIVQAHGGSISGVSMPDGGARFEVTLPLHPQADVGP